MTLRSNDQYAVAQETAYKTKIFGDIFKQTFGADAGRVLPILPGWDGATDYNTIELQFLQAELRESHPTRFTRWLSPRTSTSCPAPTSPG